MPSIYRSAEGRDEVLRWCRSTVDTWDCSHRTELLDVLGAQTHLTIAGDGPATVIYVPGTNFNTATSLPLLTALARAHRVVAVDVPGQPGLSDSVGPPDIDGHRRWLDGVTDVVAEGGRPVVLLGHSFGGAIVLASTRPVSRRVVVSTGGLCQLRLTPTMLLAFARWKVRPTASSARAILGPMHAHGRQPRPTLVEWMTLIGQLCRTTTTPDRVARPTDHGRILAVSGREDTFLPPVRLGRAVRDRAGVELSVIDGAGHLIVDELPDRIVDLVDAATNVG